MKMKVLSIIAARRGSKGIPNKNMQYVGGVPLIAWSIEASRKSTYVSRILVTTDCPEIMDYCDKAGVCFIERPKELATDEASISKAFDHAKEALEEDGYFPEYVVKLYPTSPFRMPWHIDLLIERAFTESYWVSWLQPINISEVKVEVLNENKTWKRLEIQPSIVYKGTGLGHVERKLPEDVLEVKDDPIERTRRIIKHVKNGDKKFLDSYYLHETNPVRLVDIDTPEDLELARDIGRRNVSSYDLKLPIKISSWMYEIKDGKYIPFEIPGVLEFKEGTWWNMIEKKIIRGRQDLPEFRYEEKNNS